MQPSDKHAAVEQDGDALQSSKPCTKIDITNASTKRTACQPMEDDHWSKAERVEAIHLVSYMSCNLATIMRPWKKQTLQNQVTNHAQSMTRPRPSIHVRTHGLRAHSRETIAPRPTTRSDTPFQAHVMRAGTTHGAVEQVETAMPRSKQ